MKDYLIRGVDDTHNTRFFACDITSLTNVAREKHGLWPCASAALGRMMAATLMLAANNKNNEKMTVTINGGGPIGTMIASTNSDGKIKAFVANPQVHYVYNDTDKLAVGICVGTNGTLQVIKDMGLKEPIVSTVPLQTGEIGDDFAYFFMDSEQVPSVVSLGVLVGEDNTVLSAGGYIIQLLPEATEDDIVYLEEKLKDFPAVSSLIHEGKTSEEIISMILPEGEVLEKQELSFECDCSRERMMSALMTIHTDELQDMIDKDHGCEITCQFCNTHYHFNEDELKEIIEMKNKG